MARHAIKNFPDFLPPHAGKLAPPTPEVLQFVKTGKLLSLDELWRPTHQISSENHHLNVHPVTKSSNRYILFDRFHEVNSRNPYDILHQLDICLQLKNHINTSVCEQMNKELNKYTMSLSNMSGTNFLLTITFVYLMRNARKINDEQEKFQRELGFELVVEETTGFWVEKGKRTVSNPPLLRKWNRSTDKSNQKLPPTEQSTPAAVKKPRIGFLSIQEKNILRTNQCFTAGIINFYSALRLKSCGISYQPTERIQRKYEPVQGVLLQIINIRNNHWVLLHSTVTDPTVVRVYDSMMIKTKPVAPEVALSAIQLTDGKVKNINIMSCQQQKDSTSCGPLCIGYLWALSEGEDPNNFHFVPADIRKNILRLVEDKDQVETVIMGRRTQNRLGSTLPISKHKVYFT